MKVRTRCHFSASDARRRPLMVHRKELVEQAVSHLARVGIDAGIIMAGKEARPQLSVQVASVQTLRRRLAAAQQSFDLLVVDECHHAVAASYQAIIDAFAVRGGKRINTASVLGITATPFRFDGAPLWPTFTSIYCGPTVAELVQADYLANLRVFADAAGVKQVATAGIKAAMGDFEARALDKAARVITGDVIEEFSKHAATKRALVYAVSVAHSKELCAQFLAAGYKAEHIDGATPRADRETIIERVRSGETQIMCNVEIATEGFDVPEVEAIVLVRPTLSRALHLQMVGRGMRTSGGKELCVVLDHASNFARHGSPLDARKYSLVQRAPPPRKPPSSEPTDEERRRRSEVERVDGNLVEVLPEPLFICNPDGQCYDMLTELVSSLSGGGLVPYTTWATLLHYPPNSPNRGLCITCGDRCAYVLRPTSDTWWDKALAPLLVPPRAVDMSKEVRRLLRAAHKAGKGQMTPEEIATRIRERWGAAEALRIASDESHLAARALLSFNEAGQRVRTCLSDVARKRPGPLFDEHAEVLRKTDLESVNQVLVLLPESEMLRLQKATAEAKWKLAAAQEETKAGQRRKRREKEAKALARREQETLCICDADSGKLLGFLLCSLRSLPGGDDVIEEDKSWDVLVIEEVGLSASSRPRHRLTCGDRSGFPKRDTDMWGPEWYETLAGMLVLPQQSDVAQHAAFTAKLAEKDPDRWSPQAIAQRIREQWGAQEAARIAKDDSHSAVRKLRSTVSANVASRIRECLLQLAQSSDGPLVEAHRRWSNVRQVRRLVVTTEAEARRRRAAAAAKRDTTTAP